VGKTTRRAENQTCEEVTAFAADIPGLKGEDRMMDWFRTRMAGEAGQTLVEYAMLMMLIVVITVAVLTSTGRSLAGILGHAGGAV
jgi:Flp pilus assembly pilin Flp